MAPPQPVVAARKGWPKWMDSNSVCLYSLLMSTSPITPRTTKTPPPPPPSPSPHSALSEQHQLLFSLPFWNHGICG